jgi:hypothetical protein
MQSIRNSAAIFDLEIGVRAAASRFERSPRSSNRPTDLYLCIVDHYEPQVGRPERSLSRKRVEDWLTRYPAIANRHSDADGRRPAHSFFYPWDEYDDWEMERICELSAEGYGEVELHLHHHDDTDASLRAKIRGALSEFRRRGALPQWPDGRIAFGFIHGNWALDNSRQDHGRNYCGVNNEISLLHEEGCYADFTFPAWQHTSQPRQVNSIYYAVDDPLLPKSYDTGESARVGRIGDGKGLLMIQGPLSPYMRRRGIMPWFAMDDGDLAFYRRYHPARLDRWVRAGIHVEGRPDRLLVKLHCHGAADQNREALLGSDFDALFSDAEERYNDGRRYRLHYVTAREMFNVIKSTEADIDSGASERDYLLAPPVYSQHASQSSRNNTTSSARPAPDCRREAHVIQNELQDVKTRA